MARPSDFQIHIDDACLTDSTDLKVPSKRSNSDQTVIHNDIEDMHSEPYESQVGSELSQVSHDEHTEALIHAAARAVVASIERDGYGKEESEVSGRNDDGYDGGTEGTELTYGEGTDLTDGDESHLNYDSEGSHDPHDPYDGSASSHHEDDVFSERNTHSNRSSLNSITDDEHLRSGEDNETKEQDYLKQVEECNSPISRMPSTSSNTFSLRPQPLTIMPSPHPHTPSKVQRPPFRTPSSVRALQMSSPTPSVFGSPRSGKRPTVSRIGTPTISNESPSKNKTPTRFKAKKEYPLVLLHVTVLPLRWPFGDALDSVSEEGLPRELQDVRASWNLLKEKLADTVLERGVLLPHPQDLYEVLEERLLEALELPVRPRAKILSCGHYIGPDDAGDMSSEDDSENEDYEKTGMEKERWCEICRTGVRYEELGVCGKQRRFKVKVYASNGLMRAGAWVAAWREMERVDVEIEPRVPSHLLPLMNSLVTYHAQPPQAQVFHAEETDRMREHHAASESIYAEEEAAETRKQMEEERMREVYGQSGIPSAPPPVNGHLGSQPATSSRQQYGDSLPELLLEAIKVVMRDKKHIAIFILSILVVILALRPTPQAQNYGDKTIAQVPAILEAARVPELLSTGQEYAGVVSNKASEMTASVVETVKAVANEKIQEGQAKFAQLPRQVGPKREISESDMKEEITEEENPEPKQVSSQELEREQVAPPELAIEDVIKEEKEGAMLKDHILDAPEIA